MRADLSAARPTPIALLIIIVTTHAAASHFKFISRFPFVIPLDARRALPGRSLAPHAKSIACRRFVNAWDRSAELSPKDVAPRFCGLPATPARQANGPNVAKLIAA